jgi:iron complex transport system substrate-binding protein
VGIFILKGGFFMKKGFKKHWIGVVLLVVLMVSLGGCADAGRTIVDLEGNEVVLNGKVERIVSTAPSNTQILVELGLKEKIVGISNYDSLEGDFLKIDFKKSRY